MSTCRICYEPDRLVHICKCDGTMKFVHSECIKKWIEISGRTTCELCDATYRVNVHSKNHSNAYDVMIFAIIYASVLALVLIIWCLVSL